MNPNPRRDVAYDGDGDDDGDVVDDVDVDSDSRVAGVAATTTE